MVTVKNNNVIVVLAGGMTRNTDGLWRSASYSDLGDNFGLDGHRLRVVATAFLYQMDKTQTILASGGKGQYRDVPDAPTTASLIKKELVELGIPNKSILLEDKSGTTYEQMITLLELIDQKKWQRVQVVSNGWHLPRIRAMIETRAELGKLSNMLEEAHLALIDADEVLLQKDSKNWSSIINKARESLAYRERLEIERRGVEQIKNGTYKFDGRQKTS